MKKSILAITVINGGVIPPLTRKRKRTVKEYKVKEKNILFFHI